MLAYQLYQEARQELDAGAGDSAIEKLRMSAKLAPHFKTYEVLGEFLLKRGELNEAILMLSAAAGLGNRQFRSRYLLALALRDARRFVDAAGKLREALAMHPSYRAARELLREIENEHPEVLEHIRGNEAPPGGQPA